MKTKYKYACKVQCMARGRAAIITDQLRSQFNIPRYRVRFKDKWAAADPFAIVFEDDIVIEKGEQ